MYDSELRAHIQRLARLRGENTDFTRLLTEENTEIQQRLESDWEKNKAERHSVRVLMAIKTGRKGERRAPMGKERMPRRVCKSGGMAISNFCRSVSIS